jgi:hypothetical protein
MFDGLSMSVVARAKVETHDLIRRMAAPRVRMWIVLVVLKFPIDPLFEELMVVCRKRVAYHERMRRTWARTAWMPWGRFEPDPPKSPVGEPEVSQSY